MNEQTRNTIAASALAVARHVHDGGFAAVVVSGDSNQLSRSLLALGWGVQYPGERMPKVFALDSDANYLLYKHTKPDALGVFKPDADGFREWMRAYAPELELYLNAPLVFVDDFALSGVKYREMKEFLPKYHGFSNVSFALFASKKDAHLAEHDRDLFVGAADDEAAVELRRMGQHIQGKEDVSEILKDIRSEALRLRSETLGELRDIGKAMRR